MAGRCDGMIIVRGVNVFPSRIEELVPAAPGVAPHFRIEVSRRGRTHHVAVFAQARRGFADPAQRAAAAARLAGGVKKDIGAGVEVAVVDPGTLERSVGKIRRVADPR